MHMCVVSAHVSLCMCVPLSANRSNPITNVYVTTAMLMRECVCQCGLVCVGAHVPVHVCVCFYICMLVVLCVLIALV